MHVWKHEYNKSTIDKQKKIHISSRNKSKRHTLEDIKQWLVQNQSSDAYDGNHTIKIAINKNANRT